MLNDNALTTVTNIKKLLAIEDSDDSKDSYIERAINTASAIIESLCRRKFKLAEYTDFVHEDADVLALDQYPVHGVSEDGQVAASPTLYMDGGVIYRSVKAQSTITYSAGYTLPNDATDEKPCTLPSDLQNACERLASVIYEDDETSSELDMLGVKSFQLGDLEGDFSAATNSDVYSWIPADVMTTIIAHKKALML